MLGEKTIALGSKQWTNCIIDLFDLVKKQIPAKNLLKVVKFQNSVEKCCNVWKIYIALQSSTFSHYCVACVTTVG